MAEIRNITPLNPGWPIHKPEPATPSGERKQRPRRSPGSSSQQESEPESGRDHDEGSHIDEYA